MSVDTALVLLKWRVLSVCTPLVLKLLLSGNPSKPSFCCACGSAEATVAFGCGGAG